jgi:excinuclease ABC subunit C
MKAAAADLDYELAARLRDDLGALARALEKSAVVLADATDADVFALSEDELEVAVQVFHVRGGRVRGQRGWVAERGSEDATELSSVVEHLLQQVYGGESPEGVPREVLVPVLPPEPVAMGEWLTRLRGAQVDLRVPRRGDKRALMETVARNADQSLVRHKLARAGDLTARSVALQELQEGLDLASAPLRIECFDVSHVQGTNVVASMVVFEDGLARKAEYRRFIVRAATAASGEPVVQIDDTAAMHEVLTRRFRRYLDDRVASGDIQGPDARAAIAAQSPEAGPSRIDPDTGRPRRFAYPPNLVVVDGGLPQVNAAAAALAELGIHDLPMVGLAKRLEEVWIPGREFPVILPRTSEGLYLLQRVRDEAHRFAITFHRQRRSKAMTTSVLDDIPGLGEVRRKALLRHFGSVKALKAASVEQIRQVPGIGVALGATIHRTLKHPRTQTAPAVNVTTGELLD